MHTEIDVVIRGGLIADGIGAEPRIADIAISGETIAAVGKIAARGSHEI